MVKEKARVSDTPQTWHYGLVARWWAEFNLDGPEIPYFRSLIERYGQPALDIACGTGRLLLPYLRAGLDVDGADLSPDMLALCREQAAREGLSPQLYNQPMHELELPRRYRTIYMCGSFGLGGSRAQDVQALRRIYDALEPGGVLAFDHHLPYGNPGSWRYWVKGRREQLPVEWPSSGTRRQAADGTELELMTRMVALDPLAQRWTSEIRVGQWRGEDLLAVEEYTLSGMLYFKNEAVMMLEQTGFRDLRTYGAYTETDATPDDDILVHVATK